MSVPMRMTLSASEFHKILAQFQNAISLGEYKDRIPYETWRKLKKLTGKIQIEYASPFVRIFCTVKSDTYGEDVETILYSSKVYDWGFGRFFDDYFVKEKKRMSKVSDSSMAGSTAAFATAIDTRSSTSDLTAASIDTNWSCSSGTASTAITSVDYYTTTDINTNFDYGLSEASEAILKDYEDKNKCDKENNTMKFANFDFGPCTNDNVRMSMYGLAVKNASGTWVSYDATTSSVMDVDIFNFDGAKFLYKMPVALKDIKRGDVIIHARKPMFITAVNAATVNAVDPVDGELKEILLTKSPFGFNFVTKVVNLVGTLTSAAATETNPFGNMWMFMLMSDGGKMDDILPLLMMNQGDGNINPLMMYALMSDNKNMKDILPFLMMGNGWTNSVSTEVQN